MKYLIALSLLLSTQARAADCREESLVHFFSQGKEVSSEVIGAADPCDHFGGNLVYSPRVQIYFYVNFNIPGVVDLDAIDNAFLEGGAGKEMQAIKVAVVDKGFIKRMYGDPREAVLNLGGDTLFISEIVLEENRLNELMRDFYSSR